MLRENPDLPPAVATPENEDGRKSPFSPGASDAKASGVGEGHDDTFIRAEKEDDDGYDPYSDRPVDPEPLFEEDPWR